MSERRWDFVVQDARGRRRRGTVAWCEATPVPLATPSPPTEFAIVLLASAMRVSSAPEATAVCIPGVPKIRPIAEQPPQHLPAKVEALTLPPYRMAAFAAGHIVAPVPRMVELIDVFPPHNDHPRLDRLALALLECVDADARAPFTAIVRHELALKPGTDPLEALGGRLMPEDPDARPPARAPGVLRLAKALRRLRDGKVPEITAEQFTEDVRFLKLFDDGDQPWSPEALGRLLDDVRRPPVLKTPSRRHSDGAPPPNVVPLRPGTRREPPAGDA
jgi:hypothetical protein